MKTREEAEAAAITDSNNTGQAYYVSRHGGAWVHYRADWYDKDAERNPPGPGYERHKFDMYRLYVGTPAERQADRINREKRGHHHRCPEGLK